ncbi:hypothetical protein BaRGS_00027551 [Batillaria attramentaria]|uniref:C2H2-type domain-containing protein n=1 Tax=Batillaria attramentaria TaxID=370345 RepID=A0ABD0K351_9CAEN
MGTCANNCSCCSFLSPDTSSRGAPQQIVGENVPMSRRQRRVLPVTRDAGRPVQGRMCPEAGGTEPEFQSQSNELMRERSSASDGDLFKCPKCGRGYRAAQSLQRHRWQCDMSRAFRCIQCGAVYHRPDRLKEHMACAHGLRLKGPGKGRQFKV